jgi:hypothetical protein
MDRTLSPVLSPVAITGGTINGTAIGGTTPAAGHFTNATILGSAPGTPSAGQALIGGGEGKFAGRVTSLSGLTAAGTVINEVASANCAIAMSRPGVRDWYVAVSSDEALSFARGVSAFSDAEYEGTKRKLALHTDGSVAIGESAPATTAVAGFAYVPACAGTPTGSPTARTGYAPIVIDSTNHKLYFYSGGAWRDAGP